MSTSTSPSLRQRAVDTAKAILAQNPVYLDTETTGLKSDDEIIEISIVDDSGKVLFESLIRPIKSIPPDASAVNGITNEQVKTAKPWPFLWQDIRASLFGRTVVMYNADFDLRMIRQTQEKTMKKVDLPFTHADLLKIYSDFRGEWDPNRRSYRYFSLQAAGKHSGIELPNAHRATADTLLTRALLHFIAGVAY